MLVKKMYKRRLYRVFVMHKFQGKNKYWVFFIYKHKLLPCNMPVSIQTDIIDLNSYRESMNQEDK